LEDTIVELVVGVIVGCLAIAVANQWHQLEKEIKRSEAYYQKAVSVAKTSAR
jgi:uncharacterized membrane-anchored protein YhcB (DUF1043 family)